MEETCSICALPSAVSPCFPPRRTFYAFRPEAIFGPNEISIANVSGVSSSLSRHFISMRQLQSALNIRGLIAALSSDLTAKTSPPVWTTWTLLYKAAAGLNPGHHGYKDTSAVKLMEWWSGHGLGKDRGMDQNKHFLWLWPFIVMVTIIKTGLWSSG